MSLSLISSACQFYRIMSDADAQPEFPLAQVEVFTPRILISLLVLDCKSATVGYPWIKKHIDRKSKIEAFDVSCNNEDPGFLGPLGSRSTWSRSR